MTKRILGAALTSFLLNPIAETQGNTAPTKPTVHLGMSAVDLITEIESNPDAFATEAGEEDEGAQGQKLDEGRKSKDEGRKAAKTEAKDEEAKAKADADVKKIEDEKAAKAKEGKADDAKTVELNADQKAWLELRAAAKTPEEAAEIDKQAPAFTDEEWAVVEAGAVEGRESKDDGQPDEVKAQLATAQAEVTKFKTEAEAASKRLAEVEAELVAAKAKPVAVAPMNPLMMADATQLDQAESNAVQLKEWALKHWDGADAVEASGNQPAQPAYTADQVRAAYARADKQLSSVIPAARQYLADHMAQNVNAKAVYPEIFDPSSPSHQATESILQRLPGLRTALPSIKMVMGDALVGEKIRALIYAEQPSAETQVLTAALVKADPSLAKFMPQLTSAGKAAAKPNLKLPTKPVVPLARPGSAGGRIQRPGTGKPSGAPNVEKFVTRRTETGGDELTALTEALRNVNVS